MKLLLLRSRFHPACEGDIVQHSLNVCDYLIAKQKNPSWKVKKASGLAPFLILGIIHK